MSILAAKRAITLEGLAGVDGFFHVLIQIELFIHHSGVTTAPRCWTIRPCDLLIVQTPTSFLVLLFLVSPQRCHHDICI
jgi:hypothetical protein